MKFSYLVSFGKLIVLSITATPLSLGFIPPVLSQTPAPQIIRAEIVFNQVPILGGGDPDVNSKSGRQTFVSVTTSNLINYGRHLTIDVTYDIKEARKDYTHLRKSEAFRIPAPFGYCISEYGFNKTHTNYNGTFVGQNHNFNNISQEENVRDSFFESLNIRFDGKGDDHQGNAQLTGTISIPVTLVACS
ncbi:hypothetical protein FM036_05110 [Nostoc sp. HG1]|nr:hypothetical protein [Nostoc sp. HG1]